MGLVGFLLDFKFSEVLGVGRGLIGLVALLRIKSLDSQPEMSNMDLVSTDFNDSRVFQKSDNDSLA